MIKQGIYIFPKNDEHPAGVVCALRAMQFCGCSVFVGVPANTPKAEAHNVPLVSIYRACCNSHEEQMALVKEAYENDASRLKTPIATADVVLNSVFSLN